MDEFLPELCELGKRFDDLVFLQDKDFMGIKNLFIYYYWVIIF